MISHNGAGPDTQTSRVAAVALSLRVLFGDDFVATADPAFLDSFVTRNAAWKAMLTSLWALPTGAGSLAQQPLPVSGPTEVWSSTVDRPSDAPPAPQPSSAAAPANRGSAAGAPARVEVYNPATDGAAGKERDTPWTYDEVRATLVAFLEESTGYPAEVLEDDADLEAELAIDSVKQVEALSALRERYGLTLEDNFAIRDYRTIRDVATYMTDRLNNERLRGVGA